jgi:hypothetical protein
MHSVFLVESGVTLLLDVLSRDESGVDRIESYLSHICLHIFLSDVEWSENYTDVNFSDVRYGAE